MGLTRLVLTEKVAQIRHDDNAYNVGPAQQAVQDQGDGLETDDDDQQRVQARKVDEGQHAGPVTQAARVHDVRLLIGKVQNKFRLTANQGGDGDGRGA